MVDESHSNPSIRRRKYLSAVGIGATVALAGCTGSGDGGGSGGGGDGGSSDGGSSDGDSSDGDSSDGDSNDGGQSTTTSKSQETTYQFGFSIKNMTNPWLQVFRRIGKIYAEELGHEIQVTQAGGDAQTQIQNIRSMLNSGIDGLLISPYSSDAAIGAIEQAVDQGVPVYTANSASPTDSVSLFTGFGSFNAGYRAGKLMAESLKSTYGGSRIVDLVGDQADQSAVRRSNGFKQAIKETDGVEVVREMFNKNWSQQEATKNLSSFLESDSNIDGIYAVWGGGALAARNVLDQRGMLYTKSDTENYIPIMNIDGFPGVLDAIRDGYVHTTLQQPMPFYAPISLEYLIHHLDTGSPAVPKSGSEVKAGSSANLPNTINIKNVERNGVKPLSEPYWSPGTVTGWSTDSSGELFPWLKPKTVAITEDNVDAEYLWGNYAEDIL